MRAHEFILESFYSGIPNDEYFRDKQEYARSRSPTRYGVPYTSTITGYFSGSQVAVVPVSLLKRFRGNKAEQENVRRHDVDAIKKIMQETGKLPLSRDGTEYMPYIVVAYNGQPIVFDGNHRIMAAAELGWRELPVEIKYFDGGERIESGPLHPSKVKLTDGSYIGPQEGVMENDDSEHRRELKKTGFWGKRAAGSILYARSTGRFCLAHRSKSVQEPDTWGMWGGAIDSDEDSTDAAIRELEEEAEYSGPVDLQHLWTFEHKSGFKYINFVAIVEEEFRPKMNWETQGFRWFEYGNWPEPLHPGVATLLERPDVQEKLTNL